MTETMAIVARTKGGPEVLSYEAVPLADPGPGEVLLRHTAIGINYIDTYFRSGIYPWTTDILIPGNEGAGVVEALGPGVTSLSVGDRVAYTGPIGSYRVRRSIAADRLVKLPDGISDAIGATIMLKGLTAHYLVNTSFKVQPGHVVLVHAAAGGVGLLLGQWLKSIGAVTIGTVGSPEKAALASAHGYDHIINYRTEDFVARVADITQGAKCDVVYDSVGNDTWRGSLKCLKRLGMFVSFGQSSGLITDFKLGDLSANGSLFACRPTLFDHIVTREALEARVNDLFPRILNGTLKTEVRAEFALSDAANAHRALEGRQTTGASILVPR